MSKNRIHTWLVRFVVAVGVLLTAALGLLAYTVVTGPLHPGAG